MKACVYKARTFAQRTSVVIFSLFFTVDILYLSMAGSINKNVSKKKTSTSENRGQVILTGSHSDVLPRLPTT